MLLFFGRGMWYSTHQMDNQQGEEAMKVMKTPINLRMENRRLGRRSKSAILHSAFCILNSFFVASAYCGVVATGGNVKRIHNDYIHTFTESGTFTVAKPGTVQVLVVGGGGGGGCSPYGGGGGGAGGVVYNESFAVDVGSYSVIVGAGGTGAKTSANAAGVGGYSAFSNLVANVGMVRAALCIRLHAPAGQERLGRAATEVSVGGIVRTTHSRAAAEVL